MTSPPLEPLQILVIEDESAIRAQLSDTLTREGHTVYAFGSAEEALEQLPFTTFQVSFLDYHLPGMDGLILGDYLLKNNVNMTIALMSGTLDERQLQRLSKKHRMVHLPKPFLRQQVLDVLSADLERRAERVALAAARRQETFVPQIASHVDTLAGLYEMPHLPQRVEEQLVDRIKDCMSRLRAERHFNEADRVGALAGLLSARVLGISLPRGPSGLHLEEEYDGLMRQYGLRREFSSEGE